MSALLLASLLYTAPAHVESFPVVLIEGEAPAPRAAPPAAERTDLEAAARKMPVREDFRGRLLSTVHEL